MRLRLLTVLLMLLPFSVHAAEERATAVFAGGCFWCMEPPFDDIDGVIKTTSGYTGGHVVNPSYKQVTAGNTGHLEAVEITYDPAKVSYDTLLEIYWRNVDPLDDGGQFCDRGDSYRAAVFYGTEQEHEAAKQTKAANEAKLGKTIVTRILPAATFYPAEAYHQNYYKKNPVRYKYYRFSCGRDRRLEAVWGAAASDH